MTNEHVKSKTAIKGEELYRRAEERERKRLEREKEYEYLRRLNRIRQANLDKYMMEQNRKNRCKREKFFKAVKEGKITSDTSYEDIMKIINA